MEGQSSEHSCCNFASNSRMHMCAQLVGHVRLLVISWIVAHAPLSMGFPKQEYWSGLPFPSNSRILGFFGVFNEKSTHWHSW